MEQEQYQTLYKAFCIAMQAARVSRDDFNAQADIVIKILDDNGVNTLHDQISIILQMIDQYAREFHHYKSN